MSLDLSYPNNDYKSKISLTKYVYIRNYWHSKFQVPAMLSIQCQIQESHQSIYHLWSVKGIMKSTKQ